MIMHAKHKCLHVCVRESPKGAASLKFLEGVHSLTNVSIFLCMYVCVYIVVQVSLFSYQIFNNHTCAVCGIYLTIRTILYIEFYYKLIFFEYINCEQFNLNAYMYKCRFTTLSYKKFI